MTVSNKVRIGDSIYYHADAIIEGLKENRLASGIWYVIAATAKTKETLYIVSKKELGTGMYQDLHFHVTGLAGSRAESFALITEMVQEACDLDRLDDLKEYFLEY